MEEPNLELFSVHLILRSQNLQVNIQIGFFADLFCLFAGFASFQPTQVFGAKKSPPASTNIPDPFKKGTNPVSAGASEFTIYFQTILKNPISIPIHAILILSGLFGAGDGSSKPKPAGTALFGKPQKPAASGIFGGSQSVSNTGECILCDRT